MTLIDNPPTTTAGSDRTMSTTTLATKTVTIDTTRWGTLELDPADVIEFPRGLIGLGGSAYALMPAEEGSPFRWLQSADDPDIALPVCDPWAFFPEYMVDLSDVESRRVGIKDPSEARVFVTVRAAAALEDFRVNLRTPIVIADGRGHQVINDHRPAPLRAALFADEAAA